jgi:asparagine synthase (glutamine-hydrolysing)
MGGDEIFGGYRRHLAIGADPLWSMMPKPLASELAGFSRRHSNRFPRMRQLFKLLEIAKYSDRDERIAGYFDWLPPARVLALFRPEHRAAVARSPLVEALRAFPAGETPLRRMMHLDQRYFLTDHNLNYGDKMSMAAGVEMRVPFLDPDLVRLASTIPDNGLVRGLETKWILKRAMHGVLPREIIYRAKSGFGVPIRAWLHGPLRPMLQELLSAKSLGDRGLFDITNVANLMAEEDAGRGDNAYTLLSLACIELWCRRFVDEPLHP